LPLPVCQLDRRFLALGVVSLYLIADKSTQRWRFPSFFFTGTIGGAPQSMRQDYLTTFSVKSWKQLLPGKQLEHSMSNCQACCQNHANLQAAFPALPRYTAPSSIVLLPHRQESHSFPCKSYMGYRCYCQGGARVATRSANQLERSCQEAQCSWEEWRADCENHC